MKMPHWPLPLWNPLITRDLARVRDILSALGDPHLMAPPIIHIAGTNGKGSSCGMLKAIFEAAGYKAHVYTSPHLIDFNERIVLAGGNISDDYLFEICERTRQAAERIAVSPTFFEGVTCAAFIAFSEIAADILILETGIGGRLDATNIINSPVASLITQISYDHQEYLGPSLVDIAREKAEIIKPNSLCVITAQTEEVYQELLNKCQKVNTPAFCYEYDYGVEKNSHGFDFLANNLNFMDKDNFLKKNINISLPMPALIGDHQIINAAGVVAIITALGKKFNFTSDDISTGLRNVKWPARLEAIPKDKLPRLFQCAQVDDYSNINIWLDGAHNDGGAQALSLWINDNLRSPVYLILGMTKKRNIRSFLQYFDGSITKVFTVKVLSEASSYSSEKLAEEARECGICTIACTDLLSAFKAILSDIAPNNSANIIICGSLYLAADLHKLISQS